MKALNPRMPPATNCAKCGSAIPADALAGQCPNCLLGMATETVPAANGPAVAAFHAPGRQFGDFVLGPQLGSGGMGIVYEATQVSLNRKVALKFIRDSQVASPTLLRRFTIEAEAAARLHHPNIVGIHEIGELDGQPYFSMDLVEGDSLRSLIIKGNFMIKREDGTKSNGRSRQVAIARLLAKTARALHHAHQRGVLHRDLKPANILLDRNHEPHLTDFGLAKILRQTTEQDTRQSLTGSGDIAGTPSYMSPEQASSWEVTTASDIYGLGAVLYELLTSQPPFRGSTALETLQLVQDQTPRSPRSLNRLIEKNLETICLKCLEKEPLRRFSSAEALADDLENWIEHKPIKARPSGPFVRAVQWMKRNRAGTALIAALLAGLTGALVLLSVVNHQKKRFEIQQTLLFTERVEQLTKDWDDPRRTFLVIAAKDLAILDNRIPTDASNARHLSLGVGILGDPISFAQANAAFFAELESKMSALLREPVQLDLTLVKADLIDGVLVAEAKADFVAMAAASYLADRQRNPGLTAFARSDRPVSGVLVANGKWGATRLQDLAGKSMLFPKSDDTVAIWAKARLVDAGLLRKDFKSVSNATIDAASPTLARRGAPRISSREICASILTGQVDGGATYLRRYTLDKDKLMGLTLLDNFPATPPIFAARPGLETNLIAAFSAALIGMKMSLMAESPKRSENFGWDETLAGAVAIDDSYFEPLREAMRKAARFDGLPDPFAPTPNLPAAGR